MGTIRERRVGYSLGCELLTGPLSISGTAIVSQFRSDLARFPLTSGRSRRALLRWNLGSEIGPPDFCRNRKQLANNT